MSSVVSRSLVLLALLAAPLSFVSAQESSSSAVETTTSVAEVTSSEAAESSSSPVVDSTTSSSSPAEEEEAATSSEAVTAELISATSTEASATSSAFFEPNNNPITGYTPPNQDNLGFVSSTGFDAPLIEQTLNTVAYSSISLGAGFFTNIRDTQGYLDPALPNGATGPGCPFPKGYRTAVTLIRFTFTPAGSTQEQNIPIIPYYNALGVQNNMYYGYYLGEGKISFTALSISEGSTFRIRLNGQKDNAGIYSYINVGQPFEAQLAPGTNLLEFDVLQASCAGDNIEEYTITLYPEGPASSSTGGDVPQIPSSSTGGDNPQVPSSSTAVQPSTGGEVISSSTGGDTPVVPSSTGPSPCPPPAKIDRLMVVFSPDNVNAAETSVFLSPTLIDGANTYQLARGADSPTGTVFVTVGTPTDNAVITISVNGGTPITVAAGSATSFPASAGTNTVRVVLTLPGNCGSTIYTLILTQEVVPPPEVPPPAVEPSSSTGGAVPELPSSTAPVVVPEASSSTGVPDVVVPSSTGVPDVTVPSSTGVDAEVPSSTATPSTGGEVIPEVPSSTGTPDVVVPPPTTPENPEQPPITVIPPPPQPPTGGSEQPTPEQPTPETPTPETPTPTTPGTGGQEQPGDCPYPSGLVFLENFKLTLKPTGSQEAQNVELAQTYNPAVSFYQAYTDVAVGEIEFTPGALTCGATFRVRCNHGTFQYVNTGDAVKCPKIFGTNLIEYDVIQAECAGDVIQEYAVTIYQGVPSADQPIYNAPVNTDNGVPQTFEQCAAGQVQPLPDNAPEGSVQGALPTFCEKYAKGLFGYSNSSCYQESLITAIIHRTYVGTDNIQGLKDNTLFSAALSQLTPELLKEYTDDVVAYLGAAFGCDNPAFPTYSGPTDLKAAFAPLQINKAQYDSFVATMEQVLKSFGVTDQDVATVVKPFLNSFLAGSTQAICQAADCEKAMGAQPNSKGTDLVGAYNVARSSAAHVSATVAIVVSAIVALVL